MSREVLHLALEALEYAQTNRECPSTTRQAITAIKAALAQPEQEPVGEVDSTGAVITWSNKPLNGGKLYASPPQREPLTDEEKLDLLKKHFNAVCVPDWFDALLIAIEAAHGIGKKT